MEENLSKPDSNFLATESTRWNIEDRSELSSSSSSNDIKLDNKKTTSSSSFPSSILTFISDLMSQYVNYNLVREMIAQNLVEFLFICVIITYLVYYFSQISRRPKLIGDDRSRFVEFIRKNLNDTIGCRFNPLIYFWGTNPQTALFGYLQGQTSTDEMPRNKFQRQYLYISDVQYLMSNVDLSQHYSSRIKTKRRDMQLMQLEVNVDSLERQQQEATSQLDQNIRLALGGLMEDGDSGAKNHMSSDAGNVMIKSPTFGAPIDNNNHHHHHDQRLKKELDLSSSGSSSDSGVFAGHSSSSTSSSTSSLAYMAIELGEKCACKTRYDTEPRLEPLLSDLSKRSALSEPTSDEFAREQLEFGQCALDWYKESHKNYHENKLVALVSAGMTTGSDKKYVTDTVLTLEKLGFEVCVFIRRGVGGLKLSSAKFFSPAKWRDIEAALLSVRQQRPGALGLVAIGFSFGSIELCRYLSMSGKHSLVDAAFLISCPFDPAAGGANMRKRALNRKIDAYLASNLGKQLHQAMSTATATATASVSDTGQQQQQQQEQPQQSLGASSELINYHGSSINLSTLPKIKSLVDFEYNYNRPIQNYPNMEAYAADTKLHDHIARIETPTLYLSSEDDFMAPVEYLPLDQIEANKNLCMILTKRGGHMAFINGLLWPKKPYFAQHIISKYMGAIKTLLLASPDNKLNFNNYHQSNKPNSHNKSHCLIQIFHDK